MRRPSPKAKVLRKEFTALEEYIFNARDYNTTISFFDITIRNKPKYKQTFKTPVKRQGNARGLCRRKTNHILL
jgi:hypothetical protein